MTSRSIVRGASVLASTGALKIAVASLIVLVGGTIMIPYTSYFPPDFTKGFLVDRREHFQLLYAVGFYAHILSAPIVLVLGLLQMNRWIRGRFGALHKRIGATYCVLLLGIMMPGAMLIAPHSFGGWTSIGAFMALSLLTWWFTFQGWLAARKQRIESHARWMQRSYLMVCSAVLLRLLSVYAGYLGMSAEFAYPWIAWLSWLPSWCIFEVVVHSVRTPSFR